MRQDCYIYFHFRGDTDEIFYVGKGYKNRAYSNQGRNKYWKNIVNKVGYRIEIIDKDISVNEAKIREIFYIAKFGRKDLNKGPLVNMTDGGEGAFGREFSEETRKRMSEKKKGKISSFKGKHFSEESLLKIKESAKTRFNPARSDEAKKNMSIAQLGNTNGKGNKGRVAPNKGKKCSYETIQRMKHSKTKK